MARGLGRIPPSLSDGSRDGEGTLIAEIRPTRTFRLTINVGYFALGFA